MTAVVVAAATTSVDVIVVAVVVAVAATGCLCFFMCIELVRLRQTSSELNCLTLQPLAGTPVFVSVH
jgi:hypothetical protein